MPFATGVDYTTFLSTVLGVLGVGVAGTAAVCFTILRKWALVKFAGWEREVKMEWELKRRRHADVIDRKWRLMTQLQQFQELPSVDRVVVFRGTNGGSIPQVGSPYMVASLHGHPQEVADLYKEPVRVDQFYARLLSRLALNKGALLTTATMPPDADLTKSHKVEGVVQAKLYFLALDPRRLLFLSVASYTHQFTEQELAKIDTEVAKIQALIETDPEPPVTPNPVPPASSDEIGMTPAAA